MDILNAAFHRLMNGIMCVTEAIPYTAPTKPDIVATAGFKTNYPFVYVSGFWSWGQYKKGYKTLPYWGFFTGDNYINSFNKSGFTVSAADVSPMGSAWDRACELYAQLTGTVVDYGRAHAEKYNHPRYGEDFSGRALVQCWDEKHKINLIGHSFGCPTSALLASLLAYGSEEEKAVTTDGTLSPLFEGGKKNYIHSITGLAGAYNGTSLIVSSQAIADTITYVQKKMPLPQINPLMKTLEAIAGAFEKITDGGTPDCDTGLYDMVPDNAVVLNQSIKTVPDIYYFTVPFRTTAYNEKRQSDFPDPEVTDIFFLLLGLIIGRTNLTTPKGLKLDKAWQPNDGLVNTVSERGPMNEILTDLSVSPNEKLGEMAIKKGQYYVFNTFSGSHNDLCGGTVRPNYKAKAYLTDLMKAVNSLTEGDNPRP